MQEILDNRYPRWIRFSNLFKIPLLFVLMMIRWWYRYPYINPLFRNLPERNLTIYGTTEYKNTHQFWAVIKRLRHMQSLSNISPIQLLKFSIKNGKDLKLAYRMSLWPKLYFYINSNVILGHSSERIIYSHNYPEESNLIVL